MPRFVMRQRPEKPERKIEIRRDFLYIPVSDSRNSLHSTGIEISFLLKQVSKYSPDSKIKYEYGYESDDAGSFSVYYPVEESEKSYNRRLRKYEKELAKYNEWYSKYKEKADAFVKEQERILKEEKDLEEQRQAISKKIIELKKNSETFINKARKMGGTQFY